jgi:hypothetical protein
MLKMALIENQTHSMERNLLHHNCDLMMDVTTELHMYQQELLQTKLMFANHHQNNSRNCLGQEVGTDRDERNLTQRKWMRELGGTHK